MTEHHATFFLSTGRCATQWLADRLSQVPGACVVHECWQDHALTRRLRGVSDPAAVAHGDTLLHHAERIEAALATGPYFETGFPIWTALPWLAERLAGCLRIVHLTRHPVPTALSWLSHGAWQPALLPGTPTGRVLLEAADPGTLHREYRDAWPRLSPYEKALFYWAEVHAAGLDWESAFGVPWLRLRFEEMFSDAGQKRLAEFLSVDTAVLDGERVDAFPYLLMFPVAWRTIAQHPAVMRVADALGYDPLAVDVARLQHRFGPGVVDPE